MNKNNLQDFSAADSIMGYVFQFQYALVEGLRKLRKNIDFTISIETLDDVVFESQGTPLEIIQLKHHVRSVANLANASPDLWKSIRIWCENILAGTVSSETAFFLITTASASEGTAAAYLRSGEDRDCSKALEYLNNVIRTSNSVGNANAYKAFKSLSQSQKEELIENVFIFDDFQNLEGIEDEIRDLVYYAVDECYLDSFLMRLRNWWFDRVIYHINQNHEPILSEEIHAEMHRLREQFKEDNLPIDDDIEFSEEDKSNYEDQVFVHQLKLIEINDRRIFFAIRDYYKAFVQRSRWIDENLVYAGRLDKYEETLREEWERRFERMIDDLGKDAAEQEKINAAKTLYSWIESGNHPLICLNSDYFVSRGSYQILADDMKVGWHPNFVEQLKTIIK